MAVNSPSWWTRVVFSQTPQPQTSLAWFKNPGFEAPASIALKISGVLEPSLHINAPEEGSQN